MAWSTPTTPQPSPAGAARGTPEKCALVTGIPNAGTLTTPSDQSSVVSGLASCERGASLGCLEV